MLLVVRDDGVQRHELFAHIDFGFVAGARPWFDANLLPVPERFMRCCQAAGAWDAFLNDCESAFAILQARRAQLCTVARTFAEPLCRIGFPAYIDKVLTSNTPDGVRALVEAAPHDLARRFKNLHHKLSHPPPRPLEERSSTAARRELFGGEDE
jgi:hypothetical protein